MTGTLTYQSEDKTETIPKKLCTIHVHAEMRVRIKACRPVSTSVYSNKNANVCAAFSPIKHTKTIAFADENGPSKPESIRNSNSQEHDDILGFLVCSDHITDTRD